MSYSVVRPGDRRFEPPREGDVRGVVRLSDLGLQHSRANIWRYPPGARGRRHRELVQEEVFVVVDGTLTLALGDPPERVELPRGSVAVIPPGTPLHVRNEGPDEVIVFAYGAPPERGQAEFLPDAD